MKLAIKLVAAAALGALLWFVPGLGLPAAVKWLGGTVAFIVLCFLLEGVPLGVHLLVGWALVVATLYRVAYAVPLFEKTLGESYLIFYFHFPSAISCLTLFVLAGVASLIQLINGSIRTDMRAASAIEVGLVACTITLGTGMIWADAAWGVPWVWHDKRLLTVAIMWFTYMAYLMFRMAVENPVKRARFCAVLGILFALNVPLVWFAIRWFGEVRHPMSLEMVGAEKEAMDLTKWFGAAAFFILYHAFWRLRFGANVAQSEIERLEDEFAVQRL